MAHIRTYSGHHKLFNPRQLIRGELYWPIPHGLSQTICQRIPKISELSVHEKRFGFGVRGVSRVVWPLTMFEFAMLNCENNPILLCQLLKF